MWMRGGTSKGGYFLKDDLPLDRDAFLLRVMGSPDPRQIDGIGGARGPREALGKDHCEVVACRGECVDGQALSTWRHASLLTLQPAIILET